LALSRLPAQLHQPRVNHPPSLQLSEAVNCRFSPEAMMMSAEGSIKHLIIPNDGSHAGYYQWLNSGFRPFSGPGTRLWLDMMARRQPCLGTDLTFLANLGDFLFFPCERTFRFMLCILWRGVVGEYHLLSLSMVFQGRRCQNSCAGTWEVLTLRQ
jgi:hypothetical protein